MCSLATLGPPRRTVAPSWARHAGLSMLRRRTEGRADFVIGLLDGPVERGHESLAGARLAGPEAVGEPSPSKAEVAHATFVASMLVGRGPSVLGLCPACTLLSLPVADGELLQEGFPAREAARRIAEAIGRAVALGARVIQVGLEFAPAPKPVWAPAIAAIEAAAARGVRTVMAAGNGGGLGAGPLLGCRGVVPVVAAGPDGVPHASATLGPVIGLRGLMAPGVDLPGAGWPRGFTVRSGSSFAPSFVTAAVALLHASAPGRTGDEVWNALLGPPGGARSVVPRSLDAEAAFRSLS